MLSTYKCNSVLIFGDLNQRTARRDFDTLLTVHDLENHVHFPTHCSGSSLDPVVTDLPAHTIQCLPLGFVGTSDHVAVLAKVTVKRHREEASLRTVWRWEAADWTGLRQALQREDWDNVLSGGVEQQALQFTEAVLRAQQEWVPHAQYMAKPSDQPWFGPRCRAASDAKHRAWLTYKRNPTAHNKHRHSEAAAQMRDTQAWAKERWVAATKNKLRGGQVGSKRWWGIVKDEQGVAREDTIPPLQREDGSVALSNQEKAELLAKAFSGKMTVPHPDREAPTIPAVTKDKVTTIQTTEEEVRGTLAKLEEDKATGPDGVSARILRRCADELTLPLCRLYNRCLQESTWPQCWKISHVVPVYKKSDRTLVKNYRPVSLLSVVAKVLESIICDRLTSHLDKHHILSSRQFGFRKNRSAADLHLLLTDEWSSALDKGKATAVLALDIEGAFDRVWHAALVEKLRAAGVEGKLLSLLQDYLQGRLLRVVTGGQQSSTHPIQAGVPQGSVLGPLLWNVYINDLLHLVPAARAYADDVTVSASIEPGEEKDTQEQLNAVLRRLAAWGARWQVRFATAKTQFLLVSRRQLALQLNFEGAEVMPREEAEVLGVTYDTKLTFRTHIEQLARAASRKLASLRRISWLLDSRGREVLYKAQIRSSLEYSCLAWGGAASTHLALLDRVQDRALRIIKDDDQHFLPNLQSLQHRRDVAGLSVLYKVQQMREEHLRPLRQPERRAEVNTRAAAAAPAALAVQRCHTSHHQRQFTNTYVQWWNKFLATGLWPQQDNLQRFKKCVNQWLVTQRHI